MPTIVSDSNEKASKILEKQGWKIINKVLNDFANGVDLIIEKNGQRFTVEVKRSCPHNKVGTRVRPVLGDARKCDLICIINESMTCVVLQPMHEHLKLCSSTGSRGVHKLMKLTELINA